MGRRCVWSAQGGRDVGSSAETWVDEAERPQLLESLSVHFASPRLDQRLFVMLEAQPSKVVDDRLDILRPAPGLVEVFDPQKEAAAAHTCRLMRKRRTVSVAEMQLARGRRGKPAGQHLTCT
jgi:hypothetical protein